MSCEIKFELLKSQCSDLWLLVEGDDIEGLQQLLDEGAELNVPLVVESYGNVGQAILDDSSGTLSLVIEWEKAVDVPKQSCLIVYCPEDEATNENCLEVEEVTACCNNDFKIALLNCDNKIAGYMAFSTLYKCIKENLSLADFLSEANHLDAPDADLQLIGIKGQGEPSGDGCIKTGGEAYTINSMDMCCVLVGNVEGDCE